MGVPSFYRWLSEKYPRIVADVIEAKPDVIDGVSIGVNTLDPNPNGVEFDNLYLDMNGLIHPCCHPEDKPQPESEDEMIAAVFDYIDRIFAMVRPRRLLYMAIDGVAPRAKMNQQRSRRFRAALDAVERSVKEDEVRAEWAKLGKPLPPKKPPRWDHNVITPGTPFMHKLALSLRFYVNERLSNDPGWQNIQVVFSDASVPGEGEHKIMAFVRQQRMLPGYLPNTRHVIYGMDADLIMLALATHEPHFTVIRETVTFGKARGCFRCGQKGHNAADCSGIAKVKQSEHDEVEAVKPPQPFQFLSMALLREYLAYELFVDGLPFRWDLERVIDDFVFLCFFVGNDFLPHLPSLEIREGALDDLMKMYTRRLPAMGGYLTDTGVVNLQHADAILREIGRVEADIFRRRKAIEKRNAQREAEQNRERQQRKRVRQAQAAAAKNMTKDERERLQKRRKGAIDACEAVGGVKKIEQGSALSENLSAARLLRARLANHNMDAEEIAANGDAAPEAAATAATNASNNGSAPAEQEEKVEDEEPPPSPPSFQQHLKDQLRESARVPEHEDTIRLHEDGFKQRYYEEKFGYKQPRDAERIRDVAKAYTEGLCWVLLYYYRGCCSWDWFYPYHYAPFASDLCELPHMDINFCMGKPFSPLSQLMGVLPAASAHCLPRAFADLMTDARSPILRFYPEKFDVDLNGKRWAWQAVVLLPFIEANALLDALDTVRASLNDEERARDTRGHNFLFVSSKHAVANIISAMYLRAQHLDAAAAADLTAKLEPDASSGHNGRIAPYSNAPLPAAKLELQLGRFSQTLPYNRAVSARLINPKIVAHECKLRPGVQLPAPALSASDLESISQVRRYGGRSILGSNTSRTRPYTPSVQHHAPQPPRCYSAPPDAFHTPRQHYQHQHYQQPQQQQQQQQQRYQSYSSSTQRYSTQRYSQPSRRPPSSSSHDQKYQRQYQNQYQYQSQYQDRYQDQYQDQQYRRQPRSYGYAGTSRHDASQASRAPPPPLPPPRSYGSAYGRPSHSSSYRR